MRIAKRIEWIDVLKGIGIVFVVAGHVLPRESVALIYLFHMPLFFALSGFLHKPKSDLIYFFKSKCRNLLLPYVSFLIIVYIPQALDTIVKVQDETIMKAILRPILGGKYLVGWTGAFWFVTCLFVTQQIANYLVVKFSTKANISIYLLMLVLAHIYQLIFKSLFIPWNIQVILVSCPFFYFGYILKDNLININKISIYITGMLVVFFTILKPNNSYDLKVSYYGIPAITFFSSSIIILVLFFFATDVCRIKMFNTIFTFIGRRSMVIMFLHQLIQMLTYAYITESILIRIAFGITIPSLIYNVLNFFPHTRFYFLGISENSQKNDKLIHVA